MPSTRQIADLHHCDQPSIAVSAGPTDYPKPLFVAANGPAVGATVTSATLCERIYCAPEATFSTPFVRLGLVPEGCSSVWFERTMGPEVAHRLLKDGATLSAAEALEAGMVEQVVPSEGLLDATQAAAEAWVASGRGRRIDELGAREELKEVNARESDALAQARLVCSTPLLATIRHVWGIPQTQAQPTWQSVFERSLREKRTITPPMRPAPTMHTRVTRVTHRSPRAR